MKRILAIPFVQTPYYRAQLLELSGLIPVAGGCFSMNANSLLNDIKKIETKEGSSDELRAWRLYAESYKCSINLEPQPFTQILDELDSLAATQDPILRLIRNQTKSQLLLKFDTLEGKPGYTLESIAEEYDNISACCPASDLSTKLTILNQQMRFMALVNLKNNVVESDHKHMSLLVSIIKSHQDSLSADDLLWAMCPLLNDALSQLQLCIYTPDYIETLQKEAELPSIVRELIQLIKPMLETIEKKLQSQTATPENHYLKVMCSYYKFLFKTYQLDFNTKEENLFELDKDIKECEENVMALIVDWYPLCNNTVQKQHFFEMILQTATADIGPTFHLKLLYQLNGAYPEFPVPKVPDSALPMEAWSAFICEDLGKLAHMNNFSSHFYIRLARFHNHSRIALFPSSLFLKHTNQYESTYSHLFCGSRQLLGEYIYSTVRYLECINNQSLYLISRNSPKLQSMLKHVAISFKSTFRHLKQAIHDYEAKYIQSGQWHKQSSDDSTLKENIDALEKNFLIFDILYKKHSMSQTKPTLTQTRFQELSEKLHPDNLPKNQFKDSLSSHLPGFLMHCKNKPECFATLPETQKKQLYNEYIKRLESDTFSESELFPFADQLALYFPEKVDQYEPFLVKAFKRIFEKYKYSPSFVISFLNQKTTGMYKSSLQQEFFQIINEKLGLNKTTQTLSNFRAKCLNHFLDLKKPTSKYFESLWNIYFDTINGYCDASFQPKIEDALKYYMITSVNQHETNPARRDLLSTFITKPNTLDFCIQKFMETSITRCQSLAELSELIRLFQTKTKTLLDYQKKSDLIKKITHLSIDKLKELVVLEHLQKPLETERAPLPAELMLLNIGSVFENLDMIQNYLSTPKDKQRVKDIYILIRNVFLQRLDLFIEKFDRLTEIQLQENFPVLIEQLQSLLATKIHSELEDNVLDKLYKLNHCLAKCIGFNILDKITFAFQLSHVCLSYFYDLFTSNMNFEQNRLKFVMADIQFGFSFQDKLAVLSFLESQELVSTRT